MLIFYIRIRGNLRVFVLRSYRPNDNVRLLPFVECKALVFCSLHFLCSHIENETKEKAPYITLYDMVLLF